MYPIGLTDLLGRQYRTIAHHHFREEVPDPDERRELRRLLDLRRITSRVLGWLAGALAHRWPHRPDIALDKLGKTLDDAWREELIDGPYLHRLAERSGGRGRSGIVLLRDALTSRRPCIAPRRRRGTSAPVLDPRLLVHHRSSWCQNPWAAGSGTTNSGQNL